HRMSVRSYFICVNAANTEKDYEWTCAQNSFDATVVNASERYTQLAIQGPKAAGILQRCVDIDLTPIRYYWFRQGKCDGVSSIIARTGYTGEDGFELYLLQSTQRRFGRNS